MKWTNMTILVSRTLRTLGVPLNQLSANFLGQNMLCPLSNMPFGNRVALEFGPLPVEKFTWASR